MTTSSLAVSDGRGPRSGRHSRRCCRRGLLRLFLLTMCGVARPWVSGTPPAWAQTPGAAGPTAGAPARADPEDVAAVARRLNCPICQGYNLQDCPLEVCAQMRGLIAEQLANGATDTEIIADFVSQYGPQVLNAPPRTGFHLVAWLLPIVVLGLTGTAAALFVARGRSAAGDPVPPVLAPGVPRIGEEPAGIELAAADARARLEELVDDA